MIELNDVIDKARKQNKSIIGVNGDDLITISSEDKFFQGIWNSSLKTKTACALNLKKNNLYGTLSQISNRITQSKMLVILTKSHPFIYSNDFRISRILNSKVLLKLIGKEDKIDSSLSFQAIQLISDVDRFIEGRKLIIIMYLPTKYSSTVSGDYLIRLISLLKKLSPHEYLKHYPLKRCIICKSPLDEQGIDSFKNSYHVNRYFNLPICRNHQIDYFRIAMELRNNTFNIASFTKNINTYIESNSHKCIVCEEKKKRIMSSPYCFNCLKNVATYFIEVALGLINPTKVPDSYLRLLKCPDCQKSLEREGLCRDCERNYNWRRISEHLNDGVLHWDDFVSDLETRRNYRTS